MGATSVAGAGGAEALGHALPLWSVAPFALLLVAIAVVPLVAPALWERNRHKALVALALAVPAVLIVARHEPAALAHAAHEYVAFIVLLGTLFLISGGVVLRGTLAGTPGVNLLLLAAGAVLASIVGTTGASMLLVRPLLRANSGRRHAAHVVVFFIFVVANAGGLLTPLGDPPLFLGFLRGVPFLWPLRLGAQWLFVVGVVLAIFYVVDSTILRREDLERPGDLGGIAVGHEAPLSVAGAHNLLLLLAVVALLVAAGTLSLPAGTAEVGLLAIAAVAWFTTPAALRRENDFTFGPIVEVAILFAGIFATMVPALAILNARGASLGVTSPWHFFWAAGVLSSFLDNAPTYLALASVASGLCGTDAANLGQLAAHAQGGELLRAIALGSVFMGANTYIGNGPNFMVKSIAEESGVRMPGFFGYMAWSGAVLIPVFAAVTWLFLR